MTPPLRACRARALLAVAVAVVLTLLTPTVSTARPADRVPKAQHRILGSHLTNHHTHVETWIVGYYHYRRRVRIHGHLRAKRFYGLRVSAQHCNRRHCWGARSTASCGPRTSRVYLCAMRGTPRHRPPPELGPTSACRARRRVPLPGTGSRSMSTPVSASSYADS